MGTGGGPHGDGVVVLYENVKLAVTNGVITVTVMKSDGPVIVRIKQATGEVES